MTPERIRQRLTRLSGHELETFTESALMLANSTLRSDVPDTTVNLRYGLEQAQYAVWGMEEMLARREEGTFLRSMP